MPPPSVTSAAARRIVGTQSGLVMVATRTSPSANWLPSDGADSTRTRPVAIPGEAASPLSNTVPWASSPEFRVVIGRDCTSHVRPCAIAHSRSWGAP